MSTQQHIEKANFHHLIMDIAWFGLALAATSRFLQFYAIRLGASPMELGWLAAMPSLVLVVATALSQWWRSRYDTSVRAVLIPGFFQRMIFLLPVFAPVVPEQWRVLYLIGAATFPALAQGIASTVFVMMMRETVTQAQITPLMNRRFFAMNMMVMLGALVFGVLLEWLPYPLNYQVMFAAAFIFSIISEWHITRLQSLDMPSPSPKFKEKRRRSRDLLRVPHFQSVIFVTLLAYASFYSVFAIVPLHLEQALGATEGFMAIFSIAELLAGALITLVMPRWVRQYGNRTVVAFGLVGTGLAAAIIALAPALWVTVIAAALIGAAWTVVSIGVFGFFIEHTETDDIQATTLFHQIMFSAMFIGPLIGSALVNVGLAVSTVLLLGAALRLFAAVLAHFGLAVLRGKRAQPVRRTI